MQQVLPELRHVTSGSKRDGLKALCRIFEPGSTVCGELSSEVPQVLKGNGTNRTWGNAILKLLWGWSMLCFPGFWASPTVRNPGNSEFALRAFSECFPDSPDPPILFLLLGGGAQKSKDPSRKARIYLSAEPLKSLEKRGKTPKKKTRKIAKRTKRKIKKKKQGVKGGVSGFVPDFALEKCVTVLGAQLQ